MGMVTFIKYITTCMHTHIRTCTNVHTHTHAHVHIHTITYTRTNTQNSHVCIHTHIAILTLNLLPTLMRANFLLLVSFLALLAGNSSLTNGSVLCTISCPKLSCNASLFFSKNAACAKDNH